MFQAEEKRDFAKAAAQRVPELLKASFVAEANIYTCQMLAYKAALDLLEIFW